MAAVQAHVCMLDPARVAARARPRPSARLQVQVLARFCSSLCLLSSSSSLSSPVAVVPRRSRRSVRVPSPMPASAATRPTLTPPCSPRSRPIFATVHRCARRSRATPRVSMTRLSHLHLFVQPTPCVSLTFFALPHQLIFYLHSVHAHSFPYLDRFSYLPIGAQYSKLRAQSPLCQRRIQ